MHPVHLKRDFKLEIKFSMKVTASVNPILHPFFENANPGIKVYIGDLRLFDYVLNGILDNVSVAKDTSSFAFGAKTK